MASALGKTNFNNDQLDGTVAADGFILATAANMSTVFHSGGLAPATTTTGTDTTPSVSEAYVCEVYMALGVTLTGVALLNGSAVAGNVTAYLADAAGVVLASSASTAQSGTAAYQKFAFSSTYTAKGGKYFIVVTFDSTSARFRSHILGNFSAGKLTGLTYGTLANFTAPSTFTTNLGPIADVY